MKLRSVLRTAGGFASFALLLLMSSPVIKAQTADSEEISKLLTEAEDHATLAADDAEILESYTRSTMSWESHNLKLTEIAEHVNELGKVSKQLADLSSQGSPWQQKSIGHIDFLLRDLAAQLTATIDHLKNNQSRVQMQAYRDYARASYERASETAHVISDYVEYDKASSKAEALEQKLELSESQHAGKS
jgi:hypothetical protein